MNRKAATAGPSGSVNSSSVVAAEPGGPSMNAAVTGSEKSFERSEQQHALDRVQHAH